ncbi:hypothetical protein M9H77_11781 [Catharanthus roseus]|uniref:Uncharacterized protein n=1 Tax=Catharanthus roseus TaxID=4058 RepID=A0ACC0BFL9_CATRO|nr:hypothetical protein M9H77_11781 [Catharanthus roseus]
MNGARRHTRRNGRRHSRIGCRGIVVRGLARTPMGLGLSLSRGRRWERPLNSRNCMSYCISRRDKLKANVECLLIETGSPIITNEQLMFEDAEGSNKGHVYGFVSQSAVVTEECWGVTNSSMSSVPSVSSAVGHEACIERERRLWGYM